MSTYDHKKAVSLIISAVVGMSILLLPALVVNAYQLSGNDVLNSEELKVVSLLAINDQPGPSPDLSPAQIIALQLKALQANDATDEGIAITFNFASPANKEATGPLEQFKELVKNPVYEPMLNFRSYTANKIHIEDNEAQQIAIITDKNGNKAAYLFSLSKQTGGPYKGCWMTDSVIRLQYEEKRLKV